MSVSGSLFEYTHGDETYEGYVANPESRHAPVVMIAHAWAGPGEHEHAVAERLAGLGYVGFAADVYGKGNRGNSVEENSQLMSPLLEDRSDLQRRLSIALESARGLEHADGSRVAAIGYCFGGLCVLDLARMGADVRGVVSFHGLFTPDPKLKGQPVSAKVLALHGWDDPMADPQSVLSLANEFTEAGADWQLHAYGGTMHAFTNKAANDPSFGTVYNPAADARSWHAMTNFLAEVFA
ncbi:MAG: dienelactone hydrolase family protein [Planctomycetaceae bacterium]|nr:dienelactone hydrolase family protein [Planctomycetaceae bacterium]